MIVPGLDIELYHADTESISKSGLDKVNRSIEHYLCRDKFSWTESTLIGSLVHDLVFEEESRVHCVPPSQKKKNQGKTYYDDPMCKDIRDQIISEGNLPIRYQDYKAAQTMADNVRRVVPEGLRTGMTETSMYWTDDRTGVKCRLRVDNYPIQTFPETIFDLKTTINASPREFKRSVWKYRYNVQWAHYSAGLVKLLDLDFNPGFLICAVENKPPYSVAMYQLHEDWWQAGEISRLRNLDTWAEYLNGAHETTGYFKGVRTLEMNK